MIDASLEGRPHGARLLEDLLEHEVLEVALLDRTRGNLALERLALNLGTRLWNVAPRR